MGWPEDDASQRLREIVMVLARHMARMNFASVWPTAARNYETWVQTLTSGDAHLLLEFAHHPLELWNWQELLSQFRVQCVVVAETIAIRDDDTALFQRARAVADTLLMKVAN